jgi:molybdate transport system substrate-binding protein
MRTIASAVAAFLGLALALVGCAPGSTTDAAFSPGRGGQTVLSGSITVFAAASLTGVFEQMAESFEATNPDTAVNFNFAGSSDLISQMLEGAPADVFASADQNNMQKAADADLLAGAPRVFASNTLQIVVPAGNPSDIGVFADLADPGLRVVVCAPQVPCGAATDEVEAASGRTLTPVSEESSVTDVLAKVTSGEADAGLVYVTDVLRAGNQVQGISFEESSAASNRYPIAVTADSTNEPVAAAFVQFVLSDEGQALLRSAGFAGG